jgi:hypothetical protein
MIRRHSLVWPVTRGGRRAAEGSARWEDLGDLGESDLAKPDRRDGERIANELVDDGLAALVDNPRHRRSPFLRLTDKGRQVLDTTTDQAQRRHQALLANLDGVDLVQVRTALRQLTAVVRSTVET